MRAVGGEGFGEELAFGGVGLAGGDAAEGEREALRITGRLCEETLGEGAGGFEVLHVVHEREGLERSVGAAAAGARDLARRGVEGGHRRGGRGAFPKRVETAAVQAGPWS